MEIFFWGRSGADWRRTRVYVLTLEQYAKLKSEKKQLEFLGGAGLALLEGVGHAETWYFTRHVLGVARGTAEWRKVQDEAAGFFLLGAAADAAGNHYARNPECILVSSREGVRMLEGGLNQKGDPAGLRATMQGKVAWWMNLVKQRGEQRLEPPQQPQPCRPARHLHEPVLVGRPVADL